MIKDELNEEEINQEDIKGIEAVFNAKKQLTSNDS